jgi:hypothetical protein
MCRSIIEMIAIEFADSGSAGRTKSFFTHHFMMVKKVPPRLEIELTASLRKASLLLASLSLSFPCPVLFHTVKVAISTSFLQNEQVKRTTWLLTVT